MREEGIMLTCDRCGEKVFLKLLKTENRDGGYTTDRVYEDRPEGWISVDKSFTTAIKTSHLCPECSEKLKKLLERFWSPTDVCRKGEDIDD